MYSPLWVCIPALLPVPGMCRFSAAQPDFPAWPSVPVRIPLLLLRLSLSLHPCASNHTRNTSTAHLCDALSDQRSALTKLSPECFRAASVIRYCLVDTVSQNSCVFMVFPLISPFSRHSPSLRVRLGSHRLGSPSHRYYDYAPTTLRPSRPASVYLALAILAMCSFFVLPFRSPSSQSGGKAGSAYIPLLPFAACLPETASPLTFPYDLLYMCPAL